MARSTLACKALAARFAVMKLKFNCTRLESRRRIVVGRRNVVLKAEAEADGVTSERLSSLFCVTARRTAIWRASGDAVGQGSWLNSVPVVDDRSSGSQAPTGTISAELLRYPLSGKALHMLQKALKYRKRAIIRAQSSNCRRRSRSSQGAPRMFTACLGSSI